MIVRYIVNNNLKKKHNKKYKNVETTKVNN